MSAELPAGDFGIWLGEIRSALSGNGESDVPCGACTACCRSGQFIHIGPDEVDSLAAIPAELLFPAPGQADGTMVLGYDRDGRCPMLGDTGCTVYAHRPRTCRVYDCRVFAATGTLPDEPGKAAIREQAQRWRFSVASQGDQERLEELRAAGERLSSDRATAALPATARALAALRALEEVSGEAGDTRD